MKNLKNILAILGITIILSIVAWQTTESVKNHAKATKGQIEATTLFKY